jgi:3-oxoacyl-[acyl-carrier-protein] synthase II
VTREAAITGVGLVSALGTCLEAAWPGLCAGASGIALHAGFVPPRGGCTVSAVAPVRPGAVAWRRPKLVKFMGRATLCGALAAREALAMAGVALPVADAARVGVSAATGDTGLDYATFFPALDAAWDAVSADGALDVSRLGGRASRLVDPYFSLRTLANGLPALLCQELGAQGPSHNFVQGATAGVHAVEAALDDLEDGRVDLAVVVGADALTGLPGWLAREAGGPLTRAGAVGVRGPFDRDRDGFAPGEAAAALVLERPAAARARGAPAHGRLAGTWSGSDPAGAAPLLRGPGGGRLAGIVALGEATPAGDAAEAASLRALAPGVPVTATTGALGFVGAATMLVQAAAALQALRDGVLPPVGRLRTPDPALDLPAVHGRAHPWARDARDVVACVARSRSGEHAALLVARSTP